MTWLDGIMLGLIQGLTEFIPVSSSGHLIVAREYLGIVGSDALSVDAVFQLATILAVLVYFYKDLVNLLRSKTALITVIVGTIPALIFGIFLESRMDTIFRNTHLVAWALIFGSILMYLAERFATKQGELTPKKGLIIGFFQALALVPGVSRSGATISGGLLTGLTREAAARFSFVLSFPIILGSGLKKLLDLYQAGEVVLICTPLWLGSLTAFVVGLGAIHFLISYLKNHKLTVFIWYRVILAATILVLF